MNKHFKLKRHPNGLIAVNQGFIGFFEISYNPDSERFHVHDCDPDGTTLATFNRLSNAVTYCRNWEKRLDSGTEKRPRRHA